MSDKQKDLPLFQEKPTSKNVEWFVAFLEGRDWITANDIFKDLGYTTVTENNKRKLRALADASAGRVCGHQKGYKLTRSMTKDEFDWWRNEILKISASLKARVVESDIVFFGRQGLPA
jgi:hypothetical protein